MNPLEKSYDPKGSLISRAVSDVVEMSVRAIAQRLFLLTHERPGSRKYRPKISKFYETGIVTSLYEHLLMHPEISHLEIRHEKAFEREGQGAYPRVDLQIKHPNGGWGHLIEVGDFDHKKLKSDLTKWLGEAPQAQHWFLALFREGKALKRPKGASKDWRPDDPVTFLQKELRNTEMEKAVVVKPNLSGMFQISRPRQTGEWFGFALIQRNRRAVGSIYKAGAF